MKKLYLLIILFLLAGCFPAAYSPEDGARAFSLTVNGSPINSNGRVFAYSFSDYEMQIEIYPAAFDFNLVNTSGETMRLLWDSSAIVLADGSTSRVISNGVSWNTRNNPQAPSVIPVNAKVSDTFFPLANAFISSYSGWGFDPMFTLPVQQTTTITLLFSYEVAGVVKEQTLVFTARP